MKNGVEDPYFRNFPVIFRMVENFMRKIFRKITSLNVHFHSGQNDIHLQVYDKRFWRYSVLKQY